MDPQNVDLKQTVNLPKNRFLHEGQPAADRAEAARTVGEGESLRAHSRSRAGRPPSSSTTARPTPTGASTSAPPSIKSSRTSSSSPKPWRASTRPTCRDGIATACPSKSTWITIWARGRPRCRRWKSAPPAANTRKSTSTCSARISSAWEFWASGTIRTSP